jgi:16S rRNA (guanine527-N7)-methyltransferase
MVHDDVIETLRSAQRFGFFGPGPIEDAVAHALGFVSAVDGLTECRRLVDLGSGGGLPGLVLADRRRDLSVLLIDRRQKRTDFLERAVRRLGWTHVRVRCGDVRALADDVRQGSIEPFDVATARGFGPPETTLRLGRSVVGVSGSVMISEPPSGDRWSPDLLDELQLTSERVESVRVFHRRHS